MRREWPCCCGAALSTLGDEDARVKGGRFTGYGLALLFVEAKATHGEYVRTEGGLGRESSPGCVIGLCVAGEGEKKSA